MEIHRKVFRFTSALIFSILSAVLVFAQTGAPYDLSHNVIAGGGASESTGGSYKVDGTVGQALAGTISTGNQNSLRGGFWAFEPLAPTAASVSVGGRVVNLRGGIVRRVRVLLLDASNGVERTALTNPFGYYRFDEVPVGGLYIVRAESKKFTFTPESYVLPLLEAREDIDFTAVESNGEAPISADDLPDKNQ